MFILSRFGHLDKRSLSLVHVLSPVMAITMNNDISNQLRDSNIIYNKVSRFGASEQIYSMQCRFGALT